MVSIVSILIVFFSFIFSFYFVWLYTNRLNITYEKSFDKFFVLLGLTLIISRTIFIIVNVKNFETLTWSLLPYQYVENVQTGVFDRVWLESFPWVIFRVWDLGFNFAGSLIFIPLLLGRRILGVTVQKEKEYLAAMYPLILFWGLLMFFIIYQETYIPNFDLKLLLFQVMTIVAAMIVNFRFISNIKNNKVNFNLIVYYLAFLFIIALVSNAGLVNILVYLVFLVASIFFLILRMRQVSFAQSKRKTDLDPLKERVNLIKLNKSLENNFQVSYKKVKNSTLSTTTRLEKIFMSLKKKKDEDN